MMIVKRIVPVVAVFVGFAAAPGVAHAGFFESLFGAAPAYQAQPQPYTAEPQRPLQMSEPHLMRPRKPHIAETTKPTPAQIAAIKATTIMTDKTLRDGDAVMTAHGIRIFRGPVANRHTGEDFVRIDQDRGMSGEDRSELIAINTTRSEGDAWQESGEEPVKMGRSVAVDSAPQVRKVASGKPLRRVLQ